MTRKKLIKPLMGIRFVAALWIYLYHIVMIAPFSTPFSRKIVWGKAINIIDNGTYGVEIFFLISGFIIAYVYQDTFNRDIRYDEIRKFYINRISKIFPLHLVGLFVTWILSVTGILKDMVTELMAQNVYNGFGIGLLNITLTHNWFIPMHISMNSPAWALSVEWFTYIVFPLIALFFYNVHNIRVSFFIIAVCSLFYYIILYNIASPPFIYFSRYGLPFYGPASVIRALYGFLLGYCLYKLYEQGFMKKMPWDLIFVVAVFGLVCTFIWHYNEIYEIIIVYFLLSVVIYSLANCNRLIYYLFSNPLFVYLGKISFAFYIIHYPYQVFVAFIYERYDISSSFSALHLFVSTILLLLLSSLLYHFVEIFFQTGVSGINRQRRRNHLICNQILCRKP